MGGKFGSVPAPVNWEIFDALAGLPRQVLTNKHIASRLNISIRTLERAVKKKFGESIDVVREQKSAPIRQETFVMLWNAAKKGNIAAAIFLAKNLIGFSDRQGLEMPSDAAATGKITYTAEWGSTLEAKTPGSEEDT